MRRVLVVLIGLVLGLTGLAAAGRADAASPTALIQGSGSSWANNAVVQWVSDVDSEGLRVVFASEGSSRGRLDFAGGTNDFGVSDLAYQGQDPLTGAFDGSPRPYAYVPLAAGGVALPYNLQVGGVAVRTLRLSAATIAKIFTGRITDWDDPAITADNGGSALPDLPIVPVVHSEESATSLELSSFLAQTDPTDWSAAPSPYFPAQAGQVARSGSDAVANYVAATNGAIAFDEYAYPLGANLPVADVRNAGGYYVAPTADNVAIGLTAAQPQASGSSLADLSGVFDNPDPRAYPLSYFASAIIPTSPTDSQETTAKRQALADFLAYSVCRGQAETTAIGYGPLPENLVTAALSTATQALGVDHSVDLSPLALDTCQSPTFLADDPARDYLGEIAPFPPACAAVGAGPCSATLTPTATAISVNAPGPGAAATITATLTPTTPTGTMYFLDNDDVIGALTAPTVPGEYDLTLDAGLAAGSQLLQARFAPDAASSFAPSSSPIVVVDLGPPSGPACLQPASSCTDTQNIQGTIPVGTLKIFTPYTSTNPLDLGTLALTSDDREFTAAGNFSDINVVDNRSGGLGWTITAQSSNLTDGTGHANGVINSQNVGLTHLNNIPGVGFTGIVTGTDNPAADPAVGPTATGNLGLGGPTAHTVATATVGTGTDDLNGLLTLNAPTSTEAGLFTGTITFTVA